MMGAWNPKDYTLNHPSLRVIGLKMALNNGIGYLDGFFNITLGFKEITLIFFLVYNGILNQNMVWSLNIGHFILKYQPCWNLAMKLTPYCESSLLWNHCLGSELSDYFYNLMHLGDVSSYKKCFRVRFMNLRESVS